MDKKLREITKLCVEIMNSKNRHVKGKLGHVFRLDVNVVFSLSITARFHGEFLATTQ